jgi:peroxiredoxin
LFSQDQDNDGFAMSKRFPALLVAAGAAALCISYLVATQADSSPTRIGKKVVGFELKDTHGKTVSLADFKDKKAVVVIFTGTQCPINNVYTQRLAELNKEYTAKGVQFLAINANRQDTREQIEEHARKHEIPFPVLKDEDNRVADQFGARRTPEAFVLDAAGTICYQGRIDDQFGVGYKRPKPTRRDLALALDEVLAGKKVSQPTTPVAGCLISRVKESKTEGPITFTKHIAPILQQHCQECHRPGQIGPMALLTYNDVVPWADTIREVIDERRMPPWHADPSFGKFANDRSLSPDDRETLLTWLDRGTPKGDARDLPPPREFVTGWTIGKPDAVFTMPKEYDVPAEAPKWGIPYKHIFVDTNFKEDRWVERAEAVAGALEVVHHIVVFVAPPGEKFFPGNPTTPVLTGTAPGDMPLILPPGTAKKIPAGAQLVLQMHYTPNGKAQKDRSSVGLIFAKKPPAYRVLTEPIAYPPAVQIPPGDDNFQVEATFEFKQDGRIMSFMPHMHLRGKDFRFTALYPNGKTETLLSVPRYNFNWQSIYRLEKPMPMPKGTKIHCLAHFDNSAKNPNNPDPTKTVYWGDQTWEEMMIGWIDYAYDQPAK